MPIRIVEPATTSTTPNRVRVVERAAPTKASPPKNRGLVGEVVDASVGAWDRLAAGVREDYRKSTARPVPHSVGEFLSQAAGDHKRKLGILGDVVGLIGAPVTGVLEAAAVKPYGAVMSRVVPGSDEEAWRGDMRTALMAAGPRAAPVRAAPVGVLGASTKAPVGQGVMDRVAAFDRAGVDPMLATGGRGRAAVANVVAENSVAGMRVRPALQRRVDQANAASQGIAKQYGADRGAQIAGEGVQTGVRAFAKDAQRPSSFRARAGDLYDDAFAAIPNQPVATPKTTQTLNDVLSRVSAPTLAEMTKSPTVAKAAEALKADQGQITFTDLRALRTWVREAKSKPALRESIGDADLKRLEGALSADIMANAEALGGAEAARKLRRADQFYRVGNERIDGALKGFDAASSGESAYARVLQSAGSTSSADAQKLLSLKRSLSQDEWGDVAATTIRQMGKPSPGAVGAVGDEAFSVSKFVTEYNKLSPRGREILFGSVGGGGSKATALKAELENLVQVVDQLKAVERGANASKSGVSMQNLASGAGLLNPATTIPTAKLLGSMAITGEMLTNVRAVRALTGGIKAAQKGEPAFRSYMAALKKWAKANAALLPVYEELNKGLEAQPLPRRDQIVAGRSGSS